MTHETPAVVPSTPPPKRRRRFGWLALIIAVTMLALALATEVGLKAGLAYGLRKIPLLTVAAVEGSLLSGFELRQLRYVTDYEELTISRIYLDISPHCLLRRKLCVDALIIEDFDWHIVRSRESPPFDFPAVQLPALHLPLDIEIGDARMNRMTIASAHSHFDINNTRIRLHTDNDTVYLAEARTDLEFAALTIRTGLDGNLDLRGETAANLAASVNLDFSGDVPDLNITGEIRDSAYTPELSVRTKGLVDAQTEMKASFREKGWPVYARVKQNAPIQLAEAVPVTLSDTVAIISGYVNAYHVEGETKVSGIPRTPTVTAGIITDGGFFGLTNGAVNLHIDAQQADVRGEFSWYPKLAWKTDVDFSHLDAATWVEGATSDLSGTAKVDGEWYLDVPFRNTVHELNARGQWRSYPVAVASEFTTTADSLTIAQLDARLGRNHASAKGGLTEQWDFNGNFDLPALNEVLPQLDGAVKGTATLQGPRATPMLKMEASSPQLRVYDTVLEKVTATLSGTPEQHLLTASAQWQTYAGQATLAGTLTEQNWKGQLLQLDLTRENKRFALATPAALTYTQPSTRLQLDDTCLQAGTEQLCTNTQWTLGNGKGKTELRLKDFQPAFLEPLITSVDADPGRWNGSAEAKFEKFLPTEADWQVQIAQWQLNRIGDRTFSPAMKGREARLRGRLTQKQPTKKQLAKNQLESTLDISWVHNTDSPPSDSPPSKTSVSITLPDLKQPANLNFAVNTDPLPISWAAPWITAVKLQGGKLAGKFTGSLDKGWPVLKGEIALEDGKLGTRDKSWGIDELTAQLQLDGTTATLSGKAQDDRGLQWALSTPVIARWSVQDEQVHIEQGCLSTGTTSLCAKGSYSRQLGMDLTANAKGNISPWLAPVFTDNALIDGPFEGTARLTQQQGKLIGNMQFTSTVSSTLPGANNQPPPSFDVKLRADLADDILMSRMSIQAGEHGHINGTLQANISGSKTIDGHIEVNKVDVAPLKPMIRELEQLAGEINGMFLISGTMGQPTLEGQLSLEKGELSSAIYPFAFKKVNAKATFTQQNAMLTANLESGKRGRATLTSHARWDGGRLVTETRLNGEQIQVKQGSDINLRINTDLTLASSDGRIDLGGLIYIKEGFLRVAKLPENSTNVSKDVVFIDERGNLESESGIDVHVNLAVQLSDLVQLDGLGAQVRMVGAVGIQQTPPNDPIGRGSLTITEGTYTGYGQKLKIIKGQILFNGPLDNPVLAIKAVRESNSADGSTVVAGINISGTPQQPESTLFSVPALPEQDILYYIVTGRSRQAQRSGDQFAMNQALLSVGLYGSEDFTRDLASKVGIDDFEISTSTDNDDNNSVNVGGYLSPRLFVQYGVGINTPVNTLTFRYRLTQSIFLEALSGAESALDVLYSFEVE